MLAKYKYIVLPFLLFIIAVLPLGSLIHSGLPITHDGQDHVARIANFYQNLQEGTLIPRWAGNLNWGYGHPILMFLYPLPSYIASLFHWVGFSLVDSVKMVFGFSFILSGLAMYIWIKEAFNEEAGFIAAVLYMFAPYRFVDLYVRGAIGEHVAFIFPPLLFYLFLRLSKKHSYLLIIFAALSFAGLILAHNAISLMFMPVIFFYISYLLWQTKKKKYLLFDIFYVVLIGFGLSAFFWLPAFFEGKYTLRDIVTSGEYASRFVAIKDFLSNSWSFGGSGELSKQVGLVQWFFILLAIPALVKIYKKNKSGFVFLAALLIVFLSTLFLMTQYSLPLWQTVTALQKFQFPWRFLSVTVFAAASIGGILTAFVPRKYLAYFLIGVVCLLVFVNKDYWYAKDYLYKSENFYTEVYNSSTDTGESSPIWSVRFMEKRPKSHIEVIEGKASVQEGKRTSTRHTYTINSLTTTRIRENTLYFPGWAVLVDKKPVYIEFQDQKNRGIMTFFVPQGKHLLEIRFFETKLRLIANGISLISLILITGIILIYSLNLKKILKR